MHDSNPIMILEPHVDDSGFVQAQHHDQHSLLFVSHLPLDIVRTPTCLDQVIGIANSLLHQDLLFDVPLHANLVANLVRINLFYHSLVRYGNIKPILVHYVDGQYRAATGGTRMMAMEIMPGADSISALISVQQHLLPELVPGEPVTTWHRFCDLVGATPGDRVLMRLTNSDAAYGIDWYEVAFAPSPLRDHCWVPQDDWCLKALAHYLLGQSSRFRFEREWFSQDIHWSTQ
jgi:hypothetical protein